MTSICVYKLCQGKLVPSVLAFMVTSSQKVARQLTSIARKTSKIKTSWVGRNLKDGLPLGLRWWMKVEPDVELQPLCSTDLNNPFWFQQPAWLCTGMIPGWGEIIRLLTLGHPRVCQSLCKTATGCLHLAVCFPHRNQWEPKNIPSLFKKEKERNVMGRNELQGFMLLAQWCTGLKRPMRFHISSYVKCGLLGQCHTQDDQSSIGSLTNRVMGGAPPSQKRRETAVCMGEGPGGEGGGCYQDLKWRNRPISNNKNRVATTSGQTPCVLWPTF